MGKSGAVNATVPAEQMPAAKDDGSQTKLKPYKSGQTVKYNKGHQRLSGPVAECRNKQTGG